MRKGLAGLSALAQTIMQQDPYRGHLFVFRSHRGDLFKVIWFDGQGACLFSIRPEKDWFVLRSSAEGELGFALDQLAVLLEGEEFAATADEAETPPTQRPEQKEQP